MRPEPIHILILFMLLVVIAAVVAVVVLIIAAVRKRARQRSGVPPVSGAGRGSGSTADELGKLSDLHRQGVLSDDEFAQQKRRLLEQ